MFERWYDIAIGFTDSDGKEHYPVRRWVKGADDHVDWYYSCDTAKDQATVMASLNMLRASDLDREMADYLVRSKLERLT